MATKRSRPKQWAAAVEKAQAALEQLEEAFTELGDLRDEYEEWREALPDNMQDSRTAEKLDAVVELDFGSALDEAKELIDNAQGIELPQGFGRD